MKSSEPGGHPPDSLSKSINVSVVNLAESD
jgi:hypothetical protein